MITVVLVIIAAVSYGLGSINGAIASSRFFFRRDIRAMGSGSAGLTNFYRNFGAGGVALVAGIDILKGVLAAAAGGLLLGFTGDFAVIGKLFATFCLILGDVYPVSHGFRGGRGILCGAAAAFVVDWRTGLVCVVIFLIALLFTRYVSLGSILGAASFPISVLADGYGGLAFWLALLSFMVVLLHHAGHISRMVAHTEPKFELKKDVTRRLDEDDF